MVIKSPATVAVIEDVICDVCSSSTRIPVMACNMAGSKRNGVYGAQHDGGHYQVHLCELCFFRVLSSLRRERMVNGMFDDDKPFSADEFALISASNFFGKQ